MGKADSYHAVTPIGTFTIDKAFGIADDPGCQMKYTKVTEDDYWSGDTRKGMHFNEFVNIKDVPELDEVMYGDSGYLGVEKREEIAGDEHLSKIDYRITRRSSSLPKVSDNAIDWERYIDYRKSSVRSKVEHIFHIIKNRFGFKKVRYRGIEKNFHKLNVLCACANLLMYAEAKNILYRLWDKCPF